MTEEKREAKRKRRQLRAKKRRGKREAKDEKYLDIAWRNNQQGRISIGRKIAQGRMMEACRCVTGYCYCDLDNDISEYY